MNILIKIHDPAVNEISNFINSIFLSLCLTFSPPATATAALAPVSTLQIKCPGEKIVMCQIK